MIALEVDEELYGAIQELARDHGVGVSGVIRMVMLDYLKRYKNFKAKHSERSSN